MVLQETPDDAASVERVAALDIGKAEVVCCVRVPHPSGSGRRVQEVRTFTTMTRSLQGMGDWLAGLGVTRIVMEATSDYWKPPFYQLEAAGFDVWLVNAREVKHLPGRPKTDKLDAVWLCKIAERGMVRASFVPPAPIRLLRDVTRYRVDLVGERNREKNRVEKRADQAVGRGQRHLRGVRAGDDGRSDRRAARPEGPRTDGPDPDAHQDPGSGGGVRRPVQ